MTDEGVYMEELMSVLGIGEKQAQDLVDAHDNYLMELSKLDGKTVVTLLITTAVTVASSAEVDPTTFIKMVQDVVLACASASSSDAFGDIEA